MQSRLTYGVLAALTSLVLAGCSGGAPGATPDTVDFGDLDVAPTATTGIIRGVVVDPAIRPLAGATIRISNGGETTSNDAGLFGFANLAPGSYFLQVSKIGFNQTQVSAEVEAGVADPPIVKVLLQPNPSETPFYEEHQLRAFITCGVATVVSSVGCNTFPAIGQDILGDRVYFPFEFTVLPMWAQGELVWEQTQAAGGQAIWQLYGCDGYCHGPPAMASPALTFADEELLKEYEDSILEGGLQYNIFGGPHPLCTYDSPYTPYGCGLTINQAFDVFVHHFYNFKPLEGWRFTNDGSPKIPQ